MTVWQQKWNSSPGSKRGTTSSMQHMLFPSLIAALADDILSEFPSHPRPISMTVDVSRCPRSSSKCKKTHGWRGMSRQASCPEPLFGRSRGQRYSCTCSARYVQHVATRSAFAKPSSGMTCILEQWEHVFSAKMPPMTFMQTHPKSCDSLDSRRLVPIASG